MGDKLSSLDNVIKDTDEANFVTDVIEASNQVPIVVDFWAPWCGPCKKLTPDLERNILSFKGKVRLVKINVDENQGIASQLRIQSIPAVYGFYGGKPIDGFMGAQPEAKLKEFISGLISKSGGEISDNLDNLIGEADEKLDTGLIDEAEEIYEKVLEEDSNHIGAYAGLIRAKIIVKNIDCDYLYINASDERGIDTIREKIQPFALSMGFNDVKIVILDEADYLTPQAQATLRHTIEACSATTRFILTCNYLERIISPLQSRCQTFEITPPSKTEVIEHVSNIAAKEAMLEVSVNDVQKVVSTHYPDIRKIINTLQGSVVDGQIKIDDNSLKNSQLGGLVVDALIRKAKLSEIRQILADSGAREFDDLFKYIYDKSSVLFGDREGEAILIIAKYQYEYTFVLEKEICIAAMLNKLLDIKDNIQLNTKQYIIKKWLELNLKCIRFKLSIIIKIISIVI